MTKNLREGLVGEWFLNGGQARDTSGNDYNGTITGATSTTDYFGRNDRALSFNGSSVISTGSVFSNTSTYSISMWVKLDSIGTTEMFFGTGPGASYPDIYFDTTGRIRFGGKGTDTRPISNFITTAGKWIHVIVVANNLDRIIYINGKYDNNLIQSDNAIFDTTINLGRRGDTTLPFTGDISNVKVWNRALSATEVTQLYNDTKGNYQGLFDGLVAAYDFKGDAKDWSGNGKDGTISGATLTSDRFGFNNSAYNFGGDGDYIYWSDGTFDSVFESGSYSFGCWLYKRGIAGGTSSTQGVLLSHHQGSVAYDAFWIHDTGYLTAITLSFNVNTNGILNLTDNEWHHVFFSYNSTSGNISIYANGAKITEGAFENFISTTSNWQIGRTPGTTYRYYNGDIDNVLIYDRSLSDDEVKQIYDLESKKYIYTYIENGGN